MVTPVYSAGDVDRRRRAVRTREWLIEEAMVDMVGLVVSTKAGTEGEFSVVV